jgi:cell wall-associated NlpC family hydrolase
VIGATNYRKRDDAIAYAMKFIGQPYEWGGDGRKSKGFDCSGLIQEILWSIGALPHKINNQPVDMSAQALYDYFKAKAGPVSCANGNLVFFGKSISEITHVGLTLNEYQYVEAGGGDSKNLAGMVRTRPVWYRGDKVAEIDFLA